MISLNNFYYVLYTLLFKPCKIRQAVFFPFGSLSEETCRYEPYNQNNLYLIGNYLTNMVFMYNEEPFFGSVNQNDYHIPFKNIRILANSEHSELKNAYCKENYWHDFYFFFHGFLALAWFNDAKYFENQLFFKNDYICLMNIANKDRSYRLYLASKLKELNLLDKGTVSLNLDENNLIKKEITDLKSKLSKKSKKHIYKYLTFQQQSMYADTKNFTGELSAGLDHIIYEMWQDSFFHVVPETVFYYNKLHLTEKIFKPIVSRRPFLLVGAPGNLEYLKSYGFRTFDKWIDESYDQELDNDRRIDLVVNQLHWINNLTSNQKHQMFKEMQTVLEHNYQHFFGKFKHIIVDELLENFEGCINRWNNGRFDDKAIDKSQIDFQRVRQLLIQ